MNIKISIIIPIYNAEKTLENTLNSIQRQSIRDFEVILVDDGSKDRSKSICMAFVNKDPRFTYIYQNNKGVSEARNSGLRKAIGAYIVFVDSDDALPDLALEVLLNNQDGNQGCLVCGSFVIKKTRKRKVAKILEDAVFAKKHPYVFVDGIEKIPTAPWGKLFNRSIISEFKLEFPSGIPYGEDAIFLYLYLAHVEEIRTIKEIVYEYNFCNSASAGRKYYEDYYLYMRRQLEAKKYLYETIGIDNKQEEIVFFRRCIEHYIINAPNNKCQLLLHKCISEFPLSIKDEMYGSMIINGRSKELMSMWKKDNYIYYCTEKLKRILKI